MALKKALIDATNYFARTVLGTEVQPFESCSLDPAYGASLRIEGDAAYDMSVYVREKSLKKMAYLFLFEEEPSTEVLEDLICEIANIILGRAKVEAAESDLHFDIATPRYLGDRVRIPENDLEINFLFEEEIFAIVGKRC